MSEQYIDSIMHGATIKASYSVYIELGTSICICSKAYVSTYIEPVRNLRIIYGVCGMIRTYLGLRMMPEAIVKLYTGGAVVLLGLQKSVWIIQGGSNMTGTDLCVRLYKSVPVIFEPPCSLKEVTASFYHILRNYAALVICSFLGNSPASEF